MRFFFLLIRIYPYWALPCIWVMAELAIFYRRRKSKTRFIFIGFSAALFALVILWFLGRGDLYAERWILYIYKNFLISGI
jgi:hypothetical protein